MSMFGDLKKVTRATSRALGRSFELIDGAAQAAEKSAHILTLRIRVNRLERQLEPRLVDNLIPGERAQIQHQIRSICLEIIDFVGVRNASDIVQKKNKVEADLRKQDIEGCIADIKRKKNLASTSTLKFRLPIDEIRHLQSLSYSCNQLLPLARADGQPGLEQRAQQVIEECSEKIAHLQPK